MTDRFWELISICRLILTCFISRRGGYKFSITDLVLHLNERCRLQRPIVNCITHLAEGLSQLEIGGRQIFWPSEMTTGELSWLFGEVFHPWAGNPSSYAHSAMEIGKVEWVVDAGACEGFFSLFAMEQGAQRMVAVEPLEPLCRALRMTFADESNTGRFEVFEGALWSTGGTAYLEFDPQHACETSVVSTDTGSLVTLVTLDDLAARYALGTSGMIKMDIEGAEMDALKGGMHLMREYKPKLAIAVYHGYDNARLCAEIVLTANPSYTIEFRGLYGWYRPYRPYLLFAW